MLSSKTLSRHTNFRLLITDDTFIGSIKSYGIKDHKGILQFFTRFRSLLATLKSYEKLVETVRNFNMQNEAQLE